MLRCQECLESFEYKDLYPTPIDSRIKDNPLWFLLCEDCREKLADRISEPTIELEIERLR